MRWTWRGTTAWRRSTCRVLVVAILLAAPSIAVGQPPAPAEQPPLSPAVTALLKAEYLSEDEKRQARTFHGQWTDEDLASPAARAQAALIRGIYDAAIFEDASVAGVDRKEAALLRGDLLVAAGSGVASVREQRIQAEALAGLGRREEALAILHRLAAALKDPGAQAPAVMNEAEDPTEGVRAWVLRVSLAGAEGDVGAAYREQRDALARVRGTVNRLYWPAYLAEAKLLYSKDNRSEGGEAAVEVLSLNPRAVAAWSMVGEMAVDGFNFEVAEQVAARIEAIAGGATIEGSAILARARLRQNDPEGAELAMQPALERYPRAPRLLALSSAAAALKYDDAVTKAWLARIEADFPGSGLGYAAIGSTLAEARQYDLAPPYLREAIDRDPFRPEPLIELGLMSLQAGRDDESIATLLRARALDPFHVRGDNTLKLAQRLAGYDRVESDHFIVRYTGDLDGVLAREMLPLLETMHARVAGKAPGGIDHQLPGKTVIDLMPDDRAFAVRIAGVTQIHTMAASTGPCIAMVSPRDAGGRRVGVYDWLRVVRHEYTHTVTLSRTKNRIPHWFTEAAAVYLEDSPRETKTCEMLADVLESDALFGMEEINIKFVRPKKPIERSLAYAQGHWMYEYMITRWGPRAPLDLMDRYAEGDRQEAAFSRVLGVSQEQFLAEFKLWAAEQVVAWGMAPKPGQPTLLALLEKETPREGHGAGGADANANADADAGAGEVAPGDGPEARGGRLPKPTQAMVDRWLAAYPDHPQVLQAAVKLALAAHGGEADAAMLPLLERYAAACRMDDLPHRVLTTYYLKPDAPAGGAVSADGSRAAALLPHLEYIDVREQYTPVYAAELARQYGLRRDWTNAQAKAERATIVAPFVAVHRELAAAIAINAGDLQTARRHIAALTVLEPDRAQHKDRLKAIEARIAE